VRLIFAGTPEFARVALAYLHAAGHEIALVLTQPDRPAGRGMKLQASAVKQFALDQGMAIAQPRSLRLDGKYPDDAQAARAAIEAAQADAMVVAAYGLILPQWVLDDMAPTLPAARGSLPPEGALAPRGGPSALTPRKFGCFNIHASLLPRWRGAAPIHRAIEAGDAQTGVTIMQMDAGLDTGDMLRVQALPIAASDTTASLHDKLAELGGRLMVDTLQQALSAGLQPRQQPAEGVSYAHKIEKNEALIDWAQSAALIAQRVRAFNPFPGASATLNGETLKIWATEVGPGAPPAGIECGTILALAPEGIAVAAGNSVLKLTQLQRPGGKRLNAADFQRGFELRPGMVFEKREP
jgi:methionyl-tRNA formyltransferase